MTRYDPFEEMDRMFEQLRTRMWTPEGSFGTDRRLGAGDRSLGTGFDVPARQYGESDRMGGNVSMDLTEHDGEYVFVADLPGFEREQIDLTFEDGVLTIAAESELSDERTTGEGENAAVAEFTRSRRVSERVTIPAEIEDEEIAATYRNGVLEVHLPLVENEEKKDDGKKIDIQD